MFATTTTLEAWEWPEHLQSRESAELTEGDSGDAFHNSNWPATNTIRSMSAESHQPLLGCEGGTLHSGRTPCATQGLPNLDLDIVCTELCRAPLPCPLRPATPSAKIGDQARNGCSCSTLNERSLESSQVAGLVSMYCVFSLSYIGINRCYVFHHLCIVCGLLCLAHILITSHKKPHTQRN